MLSKKISSATFAYHAITYNIFCREDGYGTKGPKRKEKAKREGTTRVIEVDTVRTRCRKAPDTVILSFIMTRWFGIHLFDPANPRFFQFVSAHQVSSSGLRIAISIIRDRLLRNRSRLNTATMKWAHVNLSNCVAGRACSRKRALRRPNLSGPGRCWAAAQRRRPFASLRISCLP
jgi:hypothetical protein